LQGLSIAVDRASVSTFSHIRQLVGIDVQFDLDRKDGQKEFNGPRTAAYFLSLQHLKVAVLVTLLNVRVQVRSGFHSKWTFA